MTISANGVVSSRAAYIGYRNLGEGAVTVNGGQWNLDDELFVGYEGTGNLTLSGGEISNAKNIVIDETYIGHKPGSTGTATVSGGTWLNRNLILGDSGSGTLSLSGGSVFTVHTHIGNHLGSNGKLTISGGRFDVRNLEIGNEGSGGVEISSGDILATSVMLGSGASGSGTLDLLGGILQTSQVSKGAGNGTITFDGGTLKLDNQAELFAGFGTGDVRIMGSGGTFDVDGNSEDIYRAATSVPLSGDGSITKTGTGTLTLSGASTYSGGTILQGGTLRLENNTAAGTGAITTLGSVISYGNDFDIANPIVINSNTTQLEVLDNDSAIQSGNISETGGSRPLEKIGTGTLTLTGTNTYTGLTTVSDGTLNLGGGAAIFDNGSVVVQGGSTLRILNSETIGSLAGSGMVNLNSNSNLTTGANNSSTFYAGTITGIGGLVKQGSGKFTLTGANTYTGETVIQAGTLALLGTPLAGAGRITLEGGTLLASGNTNLSPSRLQINSTGTLAAAAGQTLSINAESMYFGADSVWSLGSPTNTGIVEFSMRQGGVAWVFSNNHTTEINGGTLRMGNNLAAAGPFIVLENQVFTIHSGGILDLNGFQSVAIRGFNGSGTVTNDGSSSSILNTIVESNATFSGVIKDGANTSSIVKSGPATLTLTGANTYTGGTTISAGMLQIGAGGTTGSISGNIVNNGELFFSRTNDSTYGGDISGTGSLFKSSAGTLTLTGASTYAGNTTVNAGELVLTGSLGNTTLTVQDGARFSGSGTTAGSVIIQNGGTLAPGTSPGTLTMGSLMLNNGSLLEYQLGIPGPSDFAQVNGNLVLDGILNLSALSGFGSGSYQLFGYTGALTDNGLLFGNVPGLFEMSVDTSTANQVNLSVEAAIAQFWDGSNTSPNSLFDGGTGTWNSSTTNWTNSGGNSNAAWAGTLPAIFSGTAGTVTIADGFTANATGYGFEAGGYLLQADGSGGIVLGDATPFATLTGTTTIDAPISGAGSLRRGSLILSGANTFSGGTTLSGGTLVIGSNTALGTGTLTISNGTVLSQTTGGKTLSNDIIINGDFTRSGTDSSPLFLNGNVDLGPATRTITNTVVTSMYPLLFSGSISGTGGLTINNAAGRVTMAGTVENTYTGLTTVNGANGLTLWKDDGLNAIAGDLLINSDSSVYQFTGNQIADTATVTVNGLYGFNGSEAFASLMGSGHINLNQSSPGRSFSVGGGEFSGNIRDRGTYGTQFIKVGGDTLILSGENLLTGGTRVDDGILINKGIMGGVSNAATFENAFGAEAGALTNTGTAGGSNAGTIASLDHHSTGTFTSSGTITGNANVTAGLLRITGDLGGNASVSGGVFEVQGTVVGSGSISGSGVLDPMGPLSLQSLTWDGGQMATQLGTTTDTVSLGGNLNLGDDGGAFAFTPDDGFMPNTYYNILAASNLTNVLLPEFSGNQLLGLDPIFTLSGSSLRVNYAGSSTGPLLQNNGGAWTPVTADFQVAGPVVTGDPGASNTVNSLRFQPGSSLRVFNNLTVTGGRFDVPGGRATVSGGTVGTPGDFNKTGAGRLSLGGNVRVGGTANVRQGALMVNGVFSTAGGLVVFQNALLGGNGLIAGNVFNNGTVAPGNSIGTLSISGNYTQSRSGTLQIEIGSPTSFDRLIVSGTARLAGTLDVRSLGSRLAYGDQYPFLRAGRISGEFDQIHMPNPSIYRGRFLSEEGIGSLLVAPASYTLVAQSPNQRNTARALDSFIPAKSGDRMVVSTALDLLPAEAYPAAFEQISPRQYAGMADIALDQSFGRVQMLNQRLSAVRLGARGFQAIGIAPQPVVHAKNPVARTDNEPLQAAAETKWSSWLMGTGTFSDGFEQVRMMDASRESGGLLGGADYAWFDNGRNGSAFRTGIYAGYQYLEDDYNDAGRMESKSALFGLYAAYNHRGFYADAMLGAASTDYTTRRNIRFSTIERTADASPDGNEYSAAINVGYDWKASGFTFGPVFGAQYSYAETDMFTEQGADALDLRIDRQSTDEFITTLGGRVAYTWQVNEKISITPEARLLWMHRHMNGARAINASLEGGSGAGFSQSVEGREADSAFIGTGLSSQLGDRCNAFLYYNAEFRSEEDTAHSVSGGFSVSF